MTTGATVPDDDNLARHALLLCAGHARAVMEER